ncbi:lysostaphin resistance A-like protein [Desulfococcus sp.]|uniref:CPBP family intramembrane glutamic endopeptidase n=1 Tax=Desulfococcus sp. TaxID=2025834 RepID=UPI0035932D0B
MAPGPVGLRPLIACIAAAAVIELAMARMIDAGRIGPMAALGWGRTAEAAAFMVVMSRWGGGLGRIGLLPEAILPGLVRGGIWAACVGLLTAAGFAVLHLLKIDPLALLPVRLPREAHARIVLFAVGGLIGPVAEEIFFRGVLYGYLRRWGVIPAVAVSTAAFALLHAGAGLVQVAGGLLFAAAYEIEGRLAAPLVIHVAGNMAIFALPLVFQP